MVRLDVIVGIMKNMKRDINNEKAKFVPAEKINLLIPEQYDKFQSFEATNRCQSWRHSACDSFI